MTEPVCHLNYLIEAPRSLRGHCCCDCDHRHRLEDWKPGDQKQVGWVCILDFQPPDRRYVLMSHEHGICEFWDKEDKSV